MNEVLVPHLQGKGRPCRGHIPLIPGIHGRPPLWSPTCEQTPPFRVPSSPPFSAFPPVLWTHRPKTPLALEPWSPGLLLGDPKSDTAPVVALKVRCIPFHSQEPTYARPHAAVASSNRAALGPPCSRGRLSPRTWVARGMENVLRLLTSWKGVEGQSPPAQAEQGEETAWAESACSGDAVPGA